MRFAAVGLNKKPPGQVARGAGKRRFYSTDMSVPMKIGRLVALSMMT